jgi:putative ABC transport system permease protein
VFARLVRASLAARRTRLLLAFMAVTLGVGVAVALGTLAIQVGDDLARDLRSAGPNFVLLPRGGSLTAETEGMPFGAASAGDALDQRAVAAMKATFWRNNILEAAPELTTTVLLDPASGAAGERVVLVGTWFAHEVETADGPWRTGLATLRPHWPLEGAWPVGDSAEIVPGRDVAQRLGLAPGSRVRLESGGRVVEVRVSGVVTAAEAGRQRVWAPLALAQSLAARPGTVDRVWFSALVRPAPPGPVPDAATDPADFERYMCAAYPANVARELTENVAGAEARALSEVVAGEASVVSRLNLLMLLLALAGLAGSILGLLSTTTASVIERSVEIGLLRSLGAAPAQIALLLLGETCVVSLAGGAAGWVLGGLAAAAIRGDVFGEGVVLQPLLLPLALALALLVALLGTLGPLRLALRVNAAEVLRG